MTTIPSTREINSLLGMSMFYTSLYVILQVENCPDDSVVWLHTINVTVTLSVMKRRSVISVGVVDHTVVQAVLLCAKKIFTIQKKNTINL